MERKRSLQDEEGPSTSTAEVAGKRTRYIQRNQRDKMGRKRQYADAAVASTSTEPAEQLPQCPRESQEISLREMQQSSQKAEEMERLHLAIEKGDLQSVEQIVGNHREEKHFLFGKTSALFKAISCKKYDIAAFLIHVGATIHEPESDKYDRLEKDWDLINHLLYEYNKKIEASCIYRLLSMSQSPQGFNDKQQKALLSMYKHFFESSITKLLMKVLETQDFDIVFDFEREKVNRLCHWGKEYDESRGLNPINSMEILIGAKNLFSPDPEKIWEVYGVVAEELCHLSMTTVFSNDAKPYFKDAPNIQDFKTIVDALNSMEKIDSHKALIIQSVFDDYKDCEWDCELIARIPYIIGMWGEEVARAIFKEYEEFSRLLEFYEKNVLPEYKKYTEQSTKSYRMRKELMGENVFISFKEKQIRPLMEGYPSFTKYVVVQEGVSVISTNSIKLCILHVYHELKQDYAEHLDRKCLFFGSECFEKKRKVILNALRSKLFEYLVLLLNNKELHHQKLLSKYLVHFKEFQNGGKNIIIISNSQLIGPKFEGNFVEYKWDHLRDEYKDFRLKNTGYIFKGDRWSISIKKEDVPTRFSGKDILKLISGDLTEVRDGADLNCQGYNLETYVERQFHATIIDKNIFERLPNDTSFLIYGLKKRDINELTINESQVQWLKGSEDDIQQGKAIFINYKERRMNFKDFVEKTTAENRICLQYYKKVFYLMNYQGDVWKQYQKEIRQSEGDIIDWLKGNKTLIISDNAGCGKSTVMSHLIWNVRKEIYNSWVLSVDLNKFSIEDEGTDSEEDDEEDVFEDIFEMLGLENGFEKCHFRHTYNQVNYFIFLDALDEIQSKYKTKALKLIAFLRRKTKARIIITTRMHHQKELEEILNAFSHQLVPFDNESQVHCLGKLLQWKLKFPSREGSKPPQKEKKAMSRKIKSIIGELEKTNFNSHDLILAMKEIKLDDSLDSIRKKIDGLKFSELAKYILKKTCLDRETVQFMGIPLHLFMIGSIYFDSNFKVEIKSGIYSIYSKFIDVKICIHVEQKQGISYQGRGKEIIIKRDQIDAYRIHIELANQLMDKGKIEIINMSDDDKELCDALGIAFTKGEQIDFLHHTFAEYFRAESIRKNLKKDEFIGVLFDDKYYVVRRFLLSSLEGKSFENLTKEFFKDLEFLFSVLKQFVETYRESIYYEPTLKFDTINRIVKCLMESFEYSVDLNCLNEFVLALRSKLSSLYDRYVIGGCLTVKMIKILFNQSNDYLKLMFSVFKYYSNPKEIIELLSEWISIDNSGEFDSNERENENRKAERLLKVLKCKDSDGFSLLSYSAFNERIETIPKILEFSRKILGEELLVNEIIGSEKYNWAWSDFMTYADFNRITGILKTFHSVFGKEIDIFFGEKLKFMILKKTLQIELSNEFEEIINLFKECFGMEKIKEVLLSCDNYGYYLIHILVYENKNVIKNLNIVRKNLVESCEMKQFLMFKNRISQNISHYAAKNRNVNFGDILEFCSNYLEKHEIEEMLTSCDEDGWNVLHLSFRRNSTERIIECLDVIKNTFDNEDLFKKLLKGESNYKNNIFHCAAENRNVNFGDLLEFCNNYLVKHEIVEMLTICDEDGWNALHYLFQWNSTERIIECLDIIKNTLDNDELFKKLLKGETKNKRNIFHFAAENGNVNFGDLLEFCNNYLVKHEIEEMLISFDDGNGWNVLHSLFIWKSTKRIIECLDIIKNTLDDDELLKQLLKGETKNKWNIIHFAAQNENEIDISILSSHLCENEIKELLIGRNEDGETILHFGANRESTNLLNLFEYSFETLEVDKSQFEELIMATNINGDTFLHKFVEEYYNNFREELVINLIKSVKEKVSYNIFKELLNIRNERGEKFLQVKNMFSKKLNERVIECFKAILGESLIEELLN